MHSRRRLLQFGGGGGRTHNFPKISLLAQILRVVNLLEPI